MPETALAPVTDGFNADEETWIDQVWHSPEIQLMFQAYGELPTPVLERVQHIFDGDEPSATTEGVTDNEPEEGDADIEIADAIYSQVKHVEAPGSGMRAATPEEEFKSTLIHELFHFVENNTKAIDPTAVTTPETLKAMLVEPRMVGLEQFAFGWFDKGGAAYLGDVTVTLASSGDPSTWVEPGSDAAEAKENGRYEVSPDSRGLEEDLATSIGMYLSGPAFRAHLAEKHPLRYQLLRGYFVRLRSSVAGR